MLIDLPFDILHHVARRLDIRSHHNLGETCRVLHRHLDDENTARKCLEVRPSALLLTFLHGLIATAEYPAFYMGTTGTANTG